MNSLLQSRLTTLESALNTLLDSISSYNPSPSSAHALLTADTDLQSTLADLAIHQRNNARILDLQAALQKHNDDIRSTLQQLADTRASLLDIPNSLPVERKRIRKDIDTETLLGFATRIAKNAVPIAFEAPKVGPAVGQQGDGVETGEEMAKESVGLAALMEEEKRWLDPWTGVQMTPWPSEEVIKMSGLARLQAGEKFGVDEEGEAGKEEDEVMNDVGAGVERKIQTGQGTGAVRKEEKPKVFGGLDLYDPEMDD